MGWGQRSELDEAQTCRVQGSLGTPPFSQMEGLKPREVPVEQAWTTPAAGSAGPAALLNFILQVHRQLRKKIGAHI